MIPMNSLTDEFGGTLPYDHQKWIKNNVVSVCLMLHSLFVSFMKRYKC